MSKRTAHVIGNVSWTWDACDSCARSKDNPGSCHGDVEVHDDYDLMLCDEFEEMEDWMSDQKLPQEVVESEACECCGKPATVHDIEGVPSVLDEQREQLAALKADVARFRDAAEAALELNTTTPSGRITARSILTHALGESRKEVGAL